MVEGTGGLDGGWGLSPYSVEDTHTHLHTPLKAQNEAMTEALPHPLHERNCEI